MRTTHILVAAILVFLIGGLFAVSALNPSPQEPGNAETPADEPGTAVSTERVTDTEVGLAFVYPADSYELTVLPSTGDRHVKSFRLMDKDDYIELMQAETAREGPPVIMLSVYTRTNAEESPREWAQANEQASMSNLVVGDVLDSEVDGLPAAEYITDGLYRAKTIVVVNGSFAYVLSGSYLEEESPIRADFDTLVRSVEFLEAE